MNIDPATIEVGDTLTWTTWCGDTASTVAQHVTPHRISGDHGMYWEATCFVTLAESLNRTRGLRVA